MMENRLDCGMLIAESEDGHYEPIAVASTMSEAQELADDDMKYRRRQLERGESPLCPWAYRLWYRGIDGRYKGDTLEVAQ